jgi:integrase
VKQHLGKAPSGTTTTLRDAAIDFAGTLAPKPRAFFEYMVSKYSEYCEATGTDIVLDEVDLHRASTMQERRVCVTKIRKHMAGLFNYLSDRYATSTIAGVHGALSRAAGKMRSELMDIPTWPSPERAIKKVVVLPESFVRGFIGDAVNHYEAAATEGEKEIILFSAIGLATALRRSDIHSLRADNIVDTPEGPQVVKMNKKTGVETVCPIPVSLAELMRQTLRKSGRMFSLSDNWACRHLPVYFKRFEELHVVEEFYTKDSTTRRKVTVRQPLYELITPHTLRRSAITTMLIHGVPEYFVKLASGHSKNSMEFPKYVAQAKSHAHNPVRNLYQ